MYRYWTVRLLRTQFFIHVVNRLEEKGSSFAWIHSSVPWACVFQPMPTHCRSAYCFPSLLPVLLSSDPLHFHPFKDLSSVLFWICSFFLLRLLFPTLVFLALSFCLPSFILHACCFSHLLPSAQFSFPFSLSISSSPQAIYLIASPFSSSTGSFHLLVQFVSKQQMSIRCLLPNCCLSDSHCLGKEKEILRL